MLILNLILHRTLFLLVSFQKCKRIVWRGDVNISYSLILQVSNFACLFLLTRTLLTIQISVMHSNQELFYYFGHKHVLVKISNAPDKFLHYTVCYSNYFYNDNDLKTDA